MAGGEDAASLDDVRALVEAERWAEALKALGPMRRATPNDAEVWRLQTLALRGAGELNEAQLAADRWGSLDPTSVESMQIKADLLSARGKHFAAAEIAADVTKLRPDDAEAFFQLASLYRAAGLIPRARTAVQRSLELDRDRWETYELAGLIEVAGAQPAVAATFFRKALRIDPDNGRVAEHLRRAIETEQEKASGAKKAASREKKESKNRVKDLAYADKVEAKRRRKADRQLAKSSRTRSTWGNVAIVLLVLFVIGFVYYQFRPKSQGVPISTGAAANAGPPAPAGPARRGARAADEQGREIVVDQSTLEVGRCYRHTKNTETVTIEPVDCSDSHNAELFLESHGADTARRYSEDQTSYVERVCPVGALTTYAPSIRRDRPEMSIYILTTGSEVLDRADCFVFPWGPDANGTGSVKGK